MREKIKKLTLSHYLFIGIFLPILLSIPLTIGQIINAINPSVEIATTSVSQDTQVTLTLEPSILDLDKAFFMSQITMNLDIKRNVTIQTDYDLHILPRGKESGLYGVSVPFQNFEYDGWYDHILLSSDEWNVYDKYSYSSSFKVPIVKRILLRFPGDYYKTSTFYLWFGGGLVPTIKLALTSSVPRGYIITFSKPKVISPSDFYLSIIEPEDRIAIAKPTNNVLAFELIVQRDSPSIWLFLIYNLFILIFSLEVFIISKFRVKKIQDRLKIFVGLTISSVSFIWSVRQIPNVPTWSEIVLISTLVFWLWLEIKDACTSARAHS